MSGIELRQELPLKSGTLHLRACNTIHNAIKVGRVAKIARPVIPSQATQSTRGLLR